MLRQRSIDKYIVDFFIPAFKLIIEIDGSSHEFKGEEDMIRQANLEALGFRIIRFKEQEVLDGIDTTRDKIQFALSCLGGKQNLPPPSPRRRRGIEGDDVE